MSDLAPDVTLSDLAQFMIDVEKDVERLGEIARGGFGVVYRAKYQNKIVALKEVAVSASRLTLDSPRR